MPAPEPLLKRTPPDELPEAMHDAWQQSKTLRGDSTFFEVFGNHPALYRWYTESFYGEVFHGGSAPLALKELLRLRLSTLHGCRFCNQGNRDSALTTGISEAKLAAIDGATDNPVFSDLERATLELADRISLTNDHGSLDKELHDAFIEEGGVVF